MKINAGDYYLHEFDNSNRVEVIEVKTPVDEYGEIVVEILAERTQKTVYKETLRPIDTQYSAFATLPLVTRTKIAIKMGFDEYLGSLVRGGHLSPLPNNKLRETAAEHRVMEEVVREFFKALCTALGKSNWKNWEQFINKEAPIQSGLMAKVKVSNLMGMLPKLMMGENPFAEVFKNLNFGEFIAAIASKQNQLQAMGERMQLPIHEVVEFFHEFHLTTQTE